MALMPGFFGSLADAERDGYQYLTCHWCRGGVWWPPEHELTEESLLSGRPFHCWGACGAAESAERVKEGRGMTTEKLSELIAKRDGAEAAYLMSPYNSEEERLSFAAWKRAERLVVAFRSLLHEDARIKKGAPPSVSQHSRSLMKARELAGLLTSRLANADSADATRADEMRMASVVRGLETVLERLAGDRG